MTSFFQGKNVLVTGGGGFLGSHLVEHLVAADAKVRVAQRSYPSINLAALLNEIEFIPADLSQLSECLKAAEGMEIVFDLAAKIEGITGNMDHPGTIFSENSVISLNMLKAASVQGVDRFLCASSTSLYSSSAAVPTPEEEGFKDNPSPSSLGYGWANRVAELGAKFYADEFNMKTTIIRLSNIYGPRDDFSSESLHVISALIRKVFASTGCINVWGRGNQTRSFIYVAEAVAALMLATEKYAVAALLNVGTNEEVSIKELIEKIIRLSGIEVIVRFDTSKPEGQPRKAADISKIKRELNWAPSFSLETGLKETIDWYTKTYSARDRDLDSRRKSAAPVKFK